MVTKAHGYFRPGGQQRLKSTHRHPGPSGGIQFHAHSCTGDLDPDNDFICQYSIRYGELTASSVLVSVPVVVVFFFLQKQFVSGLTAGAMKG